MGNEKIQEALLASRSRLANIKDDLFTVKSFEAELERVTRGRTFFIYRAPLWRMAIATWRMLIADLSSWKKGLAAKGGLFGLLKGDPTVLRKELPADGSEAWAHDAGKHAECYQRLFPANQSTNDWASIEDLESLKKRIWTRFEALTEVRNAVAHAHERRKEEGRHIDTTEVEALFREAEEMTADLLFVACRHSYGAADELLAKDSADAVEDLVDAILLDGATTARRAWVGIGRDALYDELHRRFEAGVERDLQFNQLVWDVVSENWDREQADLPNDDRRAAGAADAGHAQEDG